MGRPEKLRNRHAGRNTHGIIDSGGGWSGGLIGLGWGAKMPHAVATAVISAVLSMMRYNLDVVKSW